MKRPTFSHRLVRVALIWGFIWPIVYLGLMTHTAHASPNRAIGLRVLQSITNPNTPTMTLQAELVGISFGASIAPQIPQERKATHAQVAQVPFVNYGWDERTPSKILEIAKGIMSVSRGQQLAAELKKSMEGAKAGSAVFMFDQEVRPKSAGREMRLVWTITIMDNGRILIPEPKLVDPDPTVLHITYISSDADELLPVGWAYPDGGHLLWQVKKQDGTVVTPITRVNTGGAYNESADDSERMVQCLANRASHSSCPTITTFVDAWTLMDEVAAGSAVIDYTRKLRPVYDEVTSSTSSEPEYRPRFTLSVDHRDYLRDSCTGGQYRNRGRKGFLLENTVDRYTVLPTRPAVRVNTFSRQDISPTENYDVSTPVQTQASALASQIVHPFDASQGLVSTAQFPEITYLAPVVTATSGNAHTNLTLQGTQSDMAYSWETVGLGKNRLTFGTIADNYWAGWGTVYDRSMSFNLSNKGIYNEFRLVRAYFDDWLKVEVNGRLVYVGPLGGDRLEVTPPPSTAIPSGGVCYQDSEWGGGPFMCYVPVQSGWDSWDYRHAGTFNYCEKRGADWEGYGGSWFCGNVVPGQVQYCSNCFRWPELSTNWNIGLSIDLLPHLRNGQNIITMRTIVAGRGEGAIQIDTSSCLLE